MVPWKPSKQCYVPVNSKTAHAPQPLPKQTPGHLTFLKNFGQIPWYVGSWDGQMPHWLALPTTHQWLFKFFPHVKAFIQM